MSVDKKLVCNKGQDSCLVWGLLHGQGLNSKDQFEHVWFFLSQILNLVQILTSGPRIQFSAKILNSRPSAQFGTRCLLQGVWLDSKTRCQSKAKQRWIVQKIFVKNSHLPPFSSLLTTFYLERGTKGIQAQKRPIFKQVHKRV